MDIFLPFIHNPKIINEGPELLYIELGPSIMQEEQYEEQIKRVIIIEIL